MTPELLKCLGLNYVRDQVAEAHSDDFARGDAHISSVAQSFRSQNTVDAGTAASAKLEGNALFRAAVREFSAAARSHVRLGFSQGHARIGGRPRQRRRNRGRHRQDRPWAGTTVEVYLSNTYIVGPLIAAGIDSFSAGGRRSPRPSP